MTTPASTGAQGITLRRRFAVAALIGTLALVLVSGWIAWRFTKAVVTGRDVLTRVQPAADASRDLALAWSDAEGYVSDAVLDGFTRSTPRAPSDGPACSTPSICYLSSLSDAQASLAVVRSKLADDPAVMALADAAEAAGAHWRAVDSTPTLTALGAGDVDRAAAITRSTAAQTAYEQMIGATTALQTAIETTRDDAVSELDRFARQLALAMSVGAAALLALLGLAYLLLRRWVLAPLDSLRSQLRAVADETGHAAPIVPSGPPELAAAGIDAEAMRRRLVNEIDSSRAAREALDQQGPVVAEIRAQLAGTEPTVPGLRVHGSLQPAEGVLAGDFWSLEVLPDGRVAVVISDVSGHGPDAGVTALRVKNIVSVVLAAGFPPDAALSRTALSFRDELGRFATCAVAVVDPRTGAVEWANAGHHPPMLLRDADGNGRPDIGEPVEYLAPTGPLVSSLGGGWTTRTTTLGPGDVLVAWTDGLTESHDAAGVELGDDGLRALLDDARRGRHGVDAAVDPAELVERVLAAARRRAVDWRRDDVTLVAVSRDPVTVPAQR